jgi:hypothetical protein
MFFHPAVYFSNTDIYYKYTRRAARPGGLADGEADIMRVAQAVKQRFPCAEEKYGQTGGIPRVMQKLCSGRIKNGAA